MAGNQYPEKINLGIYPTPLYKIEAISAITGCNVYIKRDDLCGVALGGNKVRKLEYLLAYALREGYDTVLTTGGAQSNHAMLTAACAKRLGLYPVLVLKKRGITDKKGNLLLEEIMDVPAVFVDSDSYSDVYQKMHEIMDDLRKEGRNPYLIPVGGSVPLGAIGYVDCVREMKEQADEIGINIDHIVVCSGSGGTQGGLILGSKLLGDSKVTGILVSKEDDFEEVIAGIVNEAAALIGSDISIEPADVVLREYIGEGYAIPSSEGAAAIRLMASQEAIFLDPVYTGKTFAGFLDLAKQGYFKPDENIVFIHTGGAPALFALPFN